MGCGCKGNKPKVVKPTTVVKTTPKTSVSTSK